MHISLKSKQRYFDLFFNIGNYVISISTMAGDSLFITITIWNTRSGGIHDLHEWWVSNDRILRVHTQETRNQFHKAEHEREDFRSNLRVFGEVRKTSWKFPIEFVKLVEENVRTA